jgi:hypothetical protein
MKATTYIIAAILSLQGSFLFAGNNENPKDNSFEYTNTMLKTLAPTTPAVADFSDVIPEPGVNFSNLAPVTPAEADFNDSAPEISIILAPVTPAEADFNDNIATENVEKVTLAPVTPAEADFEIMIR